MNHFVLASISTIVTSTLTEQAKISKQECSRLFTCLVFLYQLCTCKNSLIQAICSNSYLSDIIATCIYFTANPAFSKTMPTLHSQLNEFSTPAQIIHVDHLNGLSETEQAQVVTILDTIMKR